MIQSVVKIKFIVYNLSVDLSPDERKSVKL